MKFSQIKIILIPFVIFLITLVLKSFSQGLIPQGVADAAIADLIFYYAVQITFWILAAFLVNRILIVVVWEGFNAPRFFSDFVSISIYVVAFNIIYLLEFNQSFDNKAFTFTVIALVTGTALRHKAVNFFNSVTVNADRPYNIRDWIEIITDSDRKILGQVIDINRRTTRLRTEENSTIVFPNILLNNYIINNFSGSGLTGRFKISVCLDYSIDVKRAKRILIAGAIQASAQNGFLKSPEPKVVIRETSELGITYDIIYWITPWEGVAPTQATNIMYTNILEHLSKTGLAPAYPKQVLYNTSLPIDQVDYRFVPATKDILAKVEIFNSLTENELQFLSENISRCDFDKNNELIKHNTEGTSMFILIEGLLEVFIEDEKNNNIKVAQLTPGDFFGEMSLLTGETRSATVTALTDVVVFEITKPVFEKMLKERVKIIEEISEIVEKRQLQNQKKLSEAGEKKEPLIKRIKKFFHL